MPLLKEFQKRQMQFFDGEASPSKFFCDNFPHSLRLIVPQRITAERKLRE